MSAIGNAQKQVLRPAQLFGKRLRMSDENAEVMQAIAQLRQEKKDRMLRMRLKLVSAK